MLCESEAYRRSLYDWSPPDVCSGEREAVRLLLDYVQSSRPIVTRAAESVDHIHVRYTEQHAAGDALDRLDAFARGLEEK